MSRTRRVLRKGLFVVAAGGTLAALFYAVEDWRGARAWAATRRQLEARGESFDPAAYRLARVPDEQNLALAPLFARMFRYQVDPQTHALTFGPGASPDPTRKLVDDMPGGHEKIGVHLPRGLTPWNEAGHLDLARWQAYYRQRTDFPVAPAPQTPSADVLLALTRYAPVLDELARAAAERPRTVFPINWELLPPWNISLPHLAPLMNLSKTLSLRAAAELAADRPEDAIRDVELVFRLRHAAGDDPVLVGTLVSMTQTGQLLQPVWEGLADRRWSAAALDQLGSHLREIDFLAQYQRAIRGGERFFLCATMDEIKRHGGMMEYLKLVTRATNHSGSGQGDLAPLDGWLLNPMPAGWLDQNKATGCRLLEDVLDTSNPTGHRVFVERCEAGTEAEEKSAATPYNMMYRSVRSVVYSLLKRVAYFQVVVDEAATACALERYALDHHAYPERLDALVPAYCARVPTDVIDGAPLRYRRTADGRYLLYSVAWNGRDDGGTPGEPTDNPAQAKGGDWVWRYPAAPPSPPGER